jgi:hypothetical protein
MADAGKETSIELWKVVDQYPNYLVSNYGRVYSCRRKTILRIKSRPDGYRNVSLTNKKQRSFFRVHRLVAQHFIPNPDHKPQVNHKNDDPSDNRASNLEWVTTEEHGRHTSRLKRLGMHLVVAEDAAKSNLSQRELAKKHGVAHSTVWYYIKEYGHMFDESLEPPEPPILTDREIVQRAIATASRQAKPQDTRWGVVKNLVGCGSTMAKRICLKYGFDPDRTKEDFNSE